MLKVVTYIDELVKNEDLKNQSRKILMGKSKEKKQNWTGAKAARSSFA